MLGYLSDVLIDKVAVLKIVRHLNIKGKTTLTLSNFYGGLNDTYKASHFDQIFVTLESKYKPIYDFLLDTLGGDPAGWTIIENLVGGLNVIEWNNEKYKCCRFYSDGSIDEPGIMWQNFTEQTDGIIEFFVAGDTEVNGENLLFIIADGGILTGFWIVINDPNAGSDWGYYDGAFHAIGGITFEDDVLYHVKVHFDCAGAGSWYMYINDERFPAGAATYDMRNNPVAIDMVYIDAQFKGNEHSYYIAAIDYSWADDYYEERIKNLNPLWFGSIEKVQFNSDDTLTLECVDGLGNLEREELSAENYILDSAMIQTVVSNIAIDCLKDGISPGWITNQFAGKGLIAHHMTPETDTIVFANADDEEGNADIEEGSYADTHVFPGQWKTVRESLVGPGGADFAAFLKFPVGAAITDKFTFKFIIHISKGAATAAITPSLYIYDHVGLDWEKLTDLTWDDSGEYEVVYTNPPAKYRSAGSEMWFAIIGGVVYFASRLLWYSYRLWKRAELILSDHTDVFVPAIYSIVSNDANTITIAGVGADTPLIQASADDAHHTSAGGGIWANSVAIMTCGNVAGDTRDGFLRFSVDIAPRSDITTGELKIQVSGRVGNPALSIILIDLDNCPAFPDGVADQSAYPVTAISVAWIVNADGAWTIDISTLLQAFVDRPGYIQGNYIGIKIDDNGVGVNIYATCVTFDAGVTIPWLNLAWGTGFNDNAVEDEDTVEIIAPTDNIVTELAERYGAFEEVDVEATTNYLGIYPRGMTSLQTIRNCQGLDQYWFWVDAYKKFRYKITLSTSELTLTESNILERPEIILDITEFYNRCKVYGWGDVVSEMKYSQASFDLYGIWRTKIIVDESITSVALANERAQAFIDKHDMIGEALTLKIALIPQEDWLGKTAPVTTQHLSSEVLLIEGITWEQEVGKDTPFISALRLGEQPANLPSDQLLAYRLNQLHTRVVQRENLSSTRRVQHVVADSEQGALRLGHPMNDLAAWHDGQNGHIRVRKGNLRIGELANYTKFEPNGTVEFNGDATVFDDVRILPGAFTFAGVTDPTLINWQPGGVGATFKVWKFAKNDEVFATIQIPHSYKEGSDVYFHIHWTAAEFGVAEGAANVGWKVDYSWANIDGTFPSSGTVVLTDTCSGTDDGHEFSSNVLVSGVGKTISSILMLRIYRSDTGADDTWVSGVPAAQPALLEFDVHFEMDTIGSREVLIK